jgi:DNA-binding MarR family transcriptional regulator
MFGKIQMEGIDYISKIGLSTYDTALLFRLIGLAKYNGMVYASQREIAEYTGTHQANVNQAIKRLVAFGLLRKEEKGSAFQE